MKSEWQLTPTIAREWNACYSNEKLHTVLGDGKTAVEICEIDIPAEDRVWTLLHNPIFDDRALRLLACDYAEEALALVDSPDERAINAIAVSRRFANGEATQAELSAASAAAWDATWDALVGADAREAARTAAASAAARAAAWEAARNAARTAATRATAWEAVWGAVWGAAWEAVWEAFLLKLKAILQKESEAGNDT